MRGRREQNDGGRQPPCSRRPGNQTDRKHKVKGVSRGRGGGGPRAGPPGKGPGCAALWRGDGLSTAADQETPGPIAR